MRPIIDDGRSWLGRDRRGKRAEPVRGKDSKGMLSRVYTLGVPECVPGYESGYVPEYVPGNVPGYDQHSQAWYPGT